jgi:hypothetical protein
MSFFRLASLLGVDRETGSTIAHYKRLYSQLSGRHFLAGDFMGVPASQAPSFNRETGDVFVTDSAMEVLADEAGSVRVSVHPYGSGRAVYLSGFDTTTACRRLLYRALHWAAREAASFTLWTSSNTETECSYFPASRTLAVVNDSELRQTTRVRGEHGEIHDFDLPPCGIEIRKLE